MWSHYGDGLRGFCIAFDEEAITRGDTTGYVLDVAYLDAPPHVDSFIYGVAWDQDWYSHVAIEETEKAIKYQGKTGLKGEIAMYEESGEQARSEEHTSELQSLMRISYAVFCLKKKKRITEQSHKCHKRANK